MISKLQREAENCA